MPLPQLTLGGGVFAFADIMIRPHPQDRRVARRAGERLLTGRRAPVGAASVDLTDRPTLSALRPWGRPDAGELRRPLAATPSLGQVYPSGSALTAKPETLVTTPGGGDPGGG
ncbi:hypothetical protein [Streptomyces scabiei]|uniref:Uncharacterized protein n=1 Tax=Streptomyces scabiei TaxID=1930 RepID=A0A124C499_STRSC|nr:hypothetical protein [Streptomyces scabiei]GAQ63788.1 hypothetical protein SsS58_04174 [Streptomyces scabiei]